MAAEGQGNDLWSSALFGLDGCGFNGGACMAWAVQAILRSWSLAYALVEPGLSDIGPQGRDLLLHRWHCT